MRKTKAKRAPARETDPQPGDPGPALLSELLNRPLMEARARRMEALGFRKTGRKTTRPK